MWFCQENLTSALALVFMFKLNGYQQLLSEVSNQRPTGKTPLLMWNQNHGLSQHRERGGESQLVRVTGKCHRRELGHRLDHGGDKLVNRVLGWPGVPGFCSDDQEMEIWTWSEAERSKVQLACNYLPV